ncbi:hypothetical protein D3C79_856540 [compost metagenome]
MRPYIARFLSGAKYFDQFSDRAELNVRILISFAIAYSFAGLEKTEWLTTTVLLIPSFLCFSLKLSSVLIPTGLESSVHSTAILIAQPEISLSIRMSTSRSHLPS